MSAVINAHRRLEEIATEADEVVKSKSLSNAAKKGKLDALSVEVKGHRETLRTAAESGRLIVGANSLGNGSFNGFGPQVGNAPNLMPSEEQLRGLHDAVLSHKSYRFEVETKGPSSLVPDQLVPGIVALPHEPTRVLALLASSAMDAPVIEYIQHQSTTGTAGMVAAGGLKPAVVLNTVKLEARARKIAVTTKVNDEDLSDFSAFLQYVSGELQRLVIDAENLALLLGDGTGENLTGIFATSGILTRVKAASPETGIDTLALAASDLRTGPALTAATVYAMSPNTWTALTLLKDSQGRYILGNPAEQDAAKLWGVPVVQSTGITAGWVLGMSAPDVGSAFIRQGLTVQTDFGADGFEHNTTSIRCEERIALAIVKPSAAIKVTGL
ncbi:MAG: hypothetical protein QOH55_1804 [Microbacteriaceae bacterium]|jgi:HK97 family phage major capsid protein|nr:hypothetical protein [Microbacteriaceae bacterium]